MIRGKDQVEIFDNSFFRFNYDLTTDIENISDAEKKFVDEFFEFQSYPAKIGENHKFFLWSSRKVKEIEKNEESVSVIVEHYCGNKRVDSFACIVDRGEYDTDKRYKFLYLSEEKVENSTRNMAKITPGWWNMKSMFMDWSWFQNQVSLISKKIDKKINNN